MLLQFSAAHGPEECCLAVKHALRVFLQDAAQSAVTVTIAEEMPSQHGLHSVLLSLDGEYADALADRWCGTLQWQCASPFRPKHRRKN